MELKIVTKRHELKALTESVKNSGKTLGFVPTMGALHRGHLQLIDYAAQYTDVTVCSIFVNPTQFNDPEDFKKYPRNIEKDTHLLRSVSCHILYAPEAEDVYHTDSPLTENFDFGTLETVMEGKYRPGHFKGVATVVKRLFELVEPHQAFFGLKDYQQFCIISQMAKQLNLPIEIKGMETVRESDGLAMSSRNVLLTADHRAMAPVIFKTLSDIKVLALQRNVSELKVLVEDIFSRIPDVKLDYFEIADAATLQPLVKVTPGIKARAFIAAFFGKVRLIDNIAV